MIKHRKKILIVSVCALVLLILLNLLFIVYSSKLNEFGHRYAENIYKKALDDGRARLPKEYYFSKFDNVFGIMSKNVLISSMLLFFGIFSLALFLFDLRLRHLQWIILAIIVSDLLFYGIPLIKSIPLEDAYQKPLFFDIFEKDRDIFRILDFGNQIPQRNLPIFHLQKINGGDPLINSKFVRITNLISGINDTYPYDELSIVMDKRELIKNIEILSLLNVKYIISSKNQSDLLQFVKKDQENELYLNKEALPRAYTVYATKVFSDQQEIYDNLVGTDFSRYVLIESGMPQLGQDDNMSHKTYGNVQIIKYTPNIIEIRADCKSGCYMVLSENYYPGWKAYVDGNDSRIYRVNYINRGIFLEPGKHEIILAYVPKYMYYGIIGSAIGLIVLAVSLIFLKIRHPSD